MALNDLLSPHFRLSEFMSKDGADTPDSVLDDLRRQAALLEVIRSAAGDRPISINSGYRSPSHNTAVGGATHSQHPLGTAADFNVKGMQPRAVSELITGLIDQGQLPSGGLGVYDNWVHYDHRQNGNARWAEDGGPVPPRARVQMNVAGSLGQTPEVVGAASGAFEQTPQGQIPSESLSVYRPDIREEGMGVTQALMRDIGANAGSFNYPDQLAKRNATAQSLLDRYSKSDDMSAGDIPGAVLAAPVNLAKHLLSPLRRALGNREQLQTDAWSGDQGLDAIAAFSGNPELVDKYRETPGAGDWLKSLVTDSAERKAAAARGVISRLALSDAGADGQGKAYLMAAQTAGAKANAIQSLLGGYNQTADTEYGRRLKVQYGRQADAGAYHNTMQGNEAAERTRWIGPSAFAAIGKDTAGAEKLRQEARGEGIKADYGPAFAQAYLDSAHAGIGRDNAAAGASDAAAEASYANAGLRDARAESLLTKLPGELALNAAQIRTLGAKTSTYEAKTQDILADAAKIRQQTENLKQQGLLTAAQIEVMDKRGILLTANLARTWIEADNSTRLTDARIELMGINGIRADAARAASIAQAERTKKLIEAADQKLPLELQVLKARTENLNAKTREYGSALGADLGDPASGMSKARALTLLALKRGLALDLQNQGVDTKSQLAKEAAQRAEDKARFGTVMQMQEVVAKGGMPRDTANQLLHELGLPYEVKDQTPWLRWAANQLPFVNGAPDLAVVPNPGMVAAPKNNVGGANPGGPSSLSPVDATAVQSGITNPGFYENDAAGRAQFESYVSRKLLSAEAAAAIIRAKNWAQD